MDILSSMSNKSFLENLGDLTKNTVNSLLLKVPEIGVSALTNLVQDKLVDSKSRVESKSSSSSSSKTTKAAPATSTTTREIVMVPKGSDWKTYAPWVLGGGAALAAGYYVMSQRKKRRR